MVAEGAKAIRVPVGSGIAGAVAKTGERLNIADAYQDDRFDSSHDQKTGFRTRSILAAPIRDSNDEIVGVLQAINCQRGGSPTDNDGFNDLDEEGRNSFSSLYTEVEFAAVCEIPFALVIFSITFTFVHCLRLLVTRSGGHPRRSGGYCHPKRRLVR